MPPNSSTAETRAAFMNNAPVQTKFALLGLAFDSNKATRVKLPEEKNTAIDEEQNPTPKVVEKKRVSRGRKARSATLWSAPIDWEEEEGEKEEEEREQPAPEPVAPIEERKETLKKKLGVKPAHVAMMQKMKAEHRGIVRKLIAKHGADYAAMSRDIKINVWQWTKAQTRKQVYHYLLTDALPEDYERVGVRVVGGVIVPAEPEA